MPLKNVTVKVKTLAEGTDIATEQPVPGAPHVQLFKLAGSTTIGNGRAVIAVSGTAVPLNATTLECKSAVVTALAGNSQPIFVGASSVSATAGSQTGIPLYPDDAMTLEINDLNKVYINGTNVGDGVCFAYFV